MYEIRFNKLRKLREANKMRMKDVGKELGMSGTQYGKRERGEIEFTAIEFLELPFIFDINEEIFKDYILERRD